MNIEMDNILIRLSEALDTLPPIERRIATLITNYPNKIASMPIEELATACSVSAASVVRLCKRFGYSGYKDLCRAISVDLALQQKNYSYMEIYPDSGIRSIIQATCHMDMQAIERTMALCDSKTIEKAVDAMVKAKRIDFYGVGSSKLVALDGSYKFQRINKISLVQDDPHYQIITASTLRPGNVAVLISYSGATLDTIETLHVAKKAGATTISITKFGDTPLSALSDIALYADNSENLLRTSAMSSRMGQLAMIDILFTAVTSRMFQDVKQHLDDTQKDLIQKRLRL